MVGRISFAKDAGAVNPILNGRPWDAGVQSLEACATSHRGRAVVHPQPELREYTIAPRT